jgi:putative ABC transport system ATP-binding protein
MSSGSLSLSAGVAFQSAELDIAHRAQAEPSQLSGGEQQRCVHRMARQSQAAIIVVTHDEKIIPTFKRIYHIREGRTVEERGEGRSLE